VIFLVVYLLARCLLGCLMMLTLCVPRIPSMALTSRVAPPAIRPWWSLIMCLRFAFLLITRFASWLRLSRREEAWLTAEILILRHQLAVQQRRQPRHQRWTGRTGPC